MTFRQLSKKLVKCGYRTNGKEVLPVSTFRKKCGAGFEIHIAGDYGRMYHFVRYNTV
jgi:hypothetical protein